jgi:hypothetical protein
MARAHHCPWYYNHHPLIPTYFKNLTSPMYDPLVKSVSNLDKEKIFSEAKKIRPYVVLTLDGIKRRTTVKKGLNASFGEILSLDVPCHTKALQLLVDLHNKPHKRLSKIFLSLSHTHKHFVFISTFGHIIYWGRSS